MSWAGFGACKKGKGESWRSEGGRGRRIDNEEERRGEGEKEQNKVRGLKSMKSLELGKTFSCLVIR